MYSQSVYEAFLIHGWRFYDETTDYAVCDCQVEQTVRLEVQYTYMFPHAYILHNSRFIGHVFYVKYAYHATLRGEAFTALTTQYDGDGHWALVHQDHDAGPALEQ